MDEIIFVDSTGKQKMKITGHDLVIKDDDKDKKKEKEESNEGDKD